MWSFNGGEVALQAQPDGSLAGIVVAPTRFATCTHPVGEQMWKGIRARPDGSFWGFHQWFFENSSCTPQPELGPTAWRLMKTATGSSYLLVCFGTPGGTQPTIAAGGAVAGVGYGCVRSAEVAPLAATESFKHAVTLPSSRRCLSRRSFQIHLHAARYDPFRTVIVRLGSRPLAARRHGRDFVVTVDLRGRPRGAFKVSIRIVTVLGHAIAGTRTFHTCVAKRGGHHRSAKKG